MEQLEVKLPLEIRGKWIRFKEKLPFAGRKYCKTAPCSVISGFKGAGKSSLNENIATHFSDPLKQPQKTGKILDFFGSKDNEGLAWLRSPYQDSILFVVGDSVDLACSYPYKRLSKVTLKDFRNYHVIIAVSAFFSGLAEEHYFIKNIMDKLWHRTHWDLPWALTIREAANLIYSRITVGENQAQAKAYFIYVLREARHCGYAVTADAIRLKAVDIDLRTVADFTFIKAVGIYGLPREVGFLYKYFDAYSIMRMPRHRFILATKSGSLARGYFEYPPWHKTEKENLLKEFDIDIQKGEPIDYGDKGYRRVSDFEHANIIELRLQKNKKGKFNSMMFIGDLLKRSPRTIQMQIDKHNESVEKSGYCVVCKRVRGRHAEVLLEQ